MKTVILWPNVFRHPAAMFAMYVVLNLIVWAFPALKPYLLLASLLVGFGVSLAMQDRWPTYKITWERRL